MRHLLSIVCLLLLLAISLPAAAQKHPTVTLGGPQLQLVEQGLHAYDAGNWDKAAAFFRAAIELGEANLPIMNLGRTLQRSGNCFAASETFDWAAGAPAVEDPPRPVVLRTIDRYRKELEESCPARLEISCKYADAHIVVDGQTPSCGDFINLAPGSYTVVGTLEGRQVSVNTRAKAARTTLVTIDFPPDLVGAGIDPSDPRPPKGEDPKPNRPDESVNAGAWTFAAVSVVLFATGGGLLIYSESLIEEAGTTDDPAKWEEIRSGWENSRTGGFVAIGGGVAAAAIAVWFAVSGGEETEPRNVLLITPEGVSFSTSW
jgi:hypothetical protein